MSELQLLQAKIDELNKHFRYLCIKDDKICYNDYEIAYMGDHNFNFTKECILEAIKKDARCACIYALYVLKDRWLEAEPYIIKDMHWAVIYKRWVIGVGQCSPVWEYDEFLKQFGKEKADKIQSMGYFRNV